LLAAAFPVPLLGFEDVVADFDLSEDTPSFFEVEELLDFSDADLSELDLSEGVDFSGPPEPPPSLPEGFARESLR